MLNDQMTMDPGIPLQKHPISSRPDVLQDHHITGAISLFLEVTVFVENLLPLLVVMCYKRSGERTVCDKLITALSLTCIFSALVPTPMSLISYAAGTWFGGKGTCNCYQVTSTWCSLSTMAIITYLCIAQYHSQSFCGQYRPSGVCVGNIGIVIMLIYTVTLAISTLPVIGLGPEIVKENETCNSWIILTPSAWIRQIYFICYLVFGYVNIFLSSCSCIFLLLLLHKPNLASKLKTSSLKTADNVSLLLHPTPRSEDTTWVTVFLVLLLEATWIPLLIMITCQKCGFKISQTVMMYGFLATSFPGLLNPVLYGLLLDSYREGYKKILKKMCICQRPGRTGTHEGKGVNISHATRMSERKRLTRVRVRSYSQQQTTASLLSFSPGFTTHSITELVDSKDLCDEDDDTCLFVCQCHFCQLESQNHMFEADINQ